MRSNDFPGRSGAPTRRDVLRGAIRVGAVLGALPLLAACGGAASTTVSVTSAASAAVTTQAASVAPATSSQAATTASSAPAATTTATSASVAATTAATSSSTVAASAAPKAQLSGNFTTLGWGDIAYQQSMLDGYKKAFPDKVGSLKFTAAGAKAEGDVLTKVLSAWAAKTDVPDIFQLNAPTVPQLMDQGVLAPLDTLITPHKDVLSADLMAALSANGHPYAFPWRPNTGMLFYRRDLLANAGIDPASLTTWDAYMAAGKQYVQKTGGKGWLTYVPTNNSNGETLEIFMDGLKVSFYDDNGKPTAGSDPKMLQALQSYEQLLTTKTAEARSEWDAPWYTAIKNGEFATMLSAVWLDNTLKGQAPELSGKWGIMALPGYTAGAPTHQFQEGSPVLLVSASSKFADLAQSILAYQYLDKARVLEVAQQRLASKQGIFPPLIPDVLTDPMFSTPDPYYGGVKLYELNLQLGQNGVTMRFTKDFAQTLQIYNAQLDTISAGKATAEQANAAIAKEIAAKIGTSK
jgi:lactose/L-arabinose transport system substrate-binding protein